MAWETSNIVGKQKEFLKMDNYTYTRICKKQTTNLVHSGDVKFLFEKRYLRIAFYMLKPAILCQYDRFVAFQDLYSTKS